MIVRSNDPTRFRPRFVGLALLNGGLFTRDFLVEGIRDTDAWKMLDESVVAVVRSRLTALFSTFSKLKNPTEAETEKELIWPRGNRLVRYAGPAKSFGQGA
jgi:hypothetical protein